MSKNTKAIVIIGCIVFLLLFLGLFSIMKDQTKVNPDGTVGNTAGNLNNSGLFCEADGKIYFSNAYDNGTLYRMNTDGTDIEKMLDSKVKSLCADENYLYYAQQSASGKAGLGYIRSTYGIYRAPFNMRNIICLTRDTAFDMQLVNNHVYYTTTGDNGPEFRKVKIDKSENLLIENLAINPSCVFDDAIFYNGVDTNHYLYSMDPDTNASYIVWQGNLWDPVYDNGYIYYMDVANNYRLCRYSLAKDQVEILTHDRIDCFNVGGGYIYYQANSASSPALKKMNPDGSNVAVVAEGNYTDINIASGYVYFHLFESETPMYRAPLGSTSVSTFDAALAAALDATE